MSEEAFEPDESTVTLIAASSMLQVWNYGTHEQLLRAIADALSFLGSIAILDQSPGAVVVGGEHAELLRASGWSKQRIREFVVAHEQVGRRGERAAKPFTASQRSRSDRTASQTS